MNFKKIFKFIWIILKLILVLFTLLFAVATFMGGSYLQTFTLVVLAVMLVYWPVSMKNKGKKQFSWIVRLSMVLLLLLVNIIFFKPEPKKSIYISTELKERLMKIYDEKVMSWPDTTQDLYFETPYGMVHVLACGKETNPPLMMFHAASMGVHSWAENLAPVLDNYMIYAVDNIGEGNRSLLDDPLVFPQNSKEIADLYAIIADSLGVESSAVFGASNGGFIAMSYAYYNPEKVSALVLFGPMGLTQLSGQSIMMLSISTMYPFQFVRDWVAEWALGNDEYVREKYGDWFNCIMEGTIPSVAAPSPMTTEQKKQMDIPVLLFLGTKDQIVGDAEEAEEMAREFPNIQVEKLESGHLVSVEHALYVNEIISEFLTAIKE